MNHVAFFHAVTLVQLKKEAMSLLASQRSQADQHDEPDSIHITFDGNEHAFDIEYRRNGVPVAGEGV